MLSNSFTEIFSFFSIFLQSYIANQIKIQLEHLTNLVVFCINNLNNTISNLLFLNSDLLRHQKYFLKNKLLFISLKCIVQDQSRLWKTRKKFAFLHPHILEVIDADAQDVCVEVEANCSFYCCRHAAAANCVCRSQKCFESVCVSGYIYKYIYIVYIIDMYIKYIYKI